MSKKQNELFAAAAMLAFAIVGVYLAATRPRVPPATAPAPAPVSPPGPVAPATAYAPEGWKTWTDGESEKDGTAYAGYSVSYPRDFDVLQGALAAGNWIGVPRVKIAFPSDSFKEPRSNFAEGYLTVSVGSDAATLKDCYVDPKSGAELTSVATMNGAEFRRGETVDVGAGQIYTTRIYRALRFGRCYEAALTVHTGNIANYEPGAAVEFDQEKAFSVLERMFGTFAFTDKNPNGP
ncbi:MAG TPA: hypothetical protein VL500_07320 [Candidatus Eisenbacteria bacterium]|nr:hypothetical protein [Candidatus Eisenbacteria bacterium]